MPLELPIWTSLAFMPSPSRRNYIVITNMGRVNLWLDRPAEVEGSPPLGGIAAHSRPLPVETTLDRDPLSVMRGLTGGCPGC